MAKASRYKDLYNSRLLKNYGSWIYCNECNKTVGYLCYTTYEYFRFDFECNCGTVGYVEIGEGTKKSRIQDTDLIVKKKRRCCANDESPLFSTVDKNIMRYEYRVECKECNGVYRSGSERG